MSSGCARPQATVDGWGGRASLPQEGTSANRLCQRRQPSTSTCDLRVRSGDRTFRHRDVEIGWPPSRRRFEGWGDPLNDRDLQREFDRWAETEFEPGVRAERELPLPDPR